MRPWWIRCTALPALLFAAGCSTLSAPATAPDPVPAAPPSATAPPLAQEQVSARAFHGLGKLAWFRNARLDILDGDTDTLREVEGAHPASALAWSADGKWLAFTRWTDNTGRVMLAEAATGRVQELTGLPGPVAGYAWAPAGSTLAVSVYASSTQAGTPSAGGPAQGPSEIWLMDDPGKPEPRRLVSLDTPAGSLMWSPDGKQIAYLITLPYKDVETGSDALEVVPAAGGKPVRWFVAPSAGLDLAGWWPDSRGILFWIRPMHCNSCAADGLPLRSLPLGSREPISLSDVLLHRGWLSWRGDRSLLLVRGGGRPVWDNKTLAICDVVTGKCQDLPSQPDDRVSIDPAWSPDGSQIAYVSATRRPGEWGFAGEQQLKDWVASRTLWLTRPDGSGKRELTSAGKGIYSPAWSTDGKSLLYGKENALWVLRLDQDKPGLVVSLGDPKELSGYYGHINWRYSVAWYPKPEGNR